MPPQTRASSPVQKSSAPQRGAGGAGGLDRAPLVGRRVVAEAVRARRLGAEIRFGAAPDEHLPAHPRDRAQVARVLREGRERAPPEAPRGVEQGDLVVLPRAAEGPDEPPVRGADRPLREARRAGCAHRAPATVPGVVDRAAALEGAPDQHPRVEGGDHEAPPVAAEGSPRGQRLPAARRRIEQRPVGEVAGGPLSAPDEEPAAHLGARREGPGRRRAVVGDANPPARVRRRATAGQPGDARRRGRGVALADDGLRAPCPEERHGDEGRVSSADAPERGDRWSAVNARGHGGSLPSTRATVWSRWPRSMGRARSSPGHQAGEHRGGARRCKAALHPDAAQTERVGRSDHVRQRHRWPRALRGKAYGCAGVGLRP